MHFAFSDDQTEMQEMIRTSLSRISPASVVRAAWAGRPAGLWEQLAELGLTGASTPESVGGLGMGATDWVLLLEEAGRAAVPAPLTEAIAVAPFLAEAGLEDRSAQVAAGRAVVSIGIEDGFALDADIADIVLHVRSGVVSAVRPVTVTPQPAVDGARRLFSVSGPSEVLHGDTAALLRRLQLANSAQLLGLGRHIVDAAVAYASARAQFGKPIGSFQAVQHHLVDAALQLRFAAPMVYRAAWSIDEQDPDVDLHLSMAWLYACRAARQACRRSLQVHGAIGYTDELDLHLWMKRVWSLAAAGGRDADHTERVADAVLGAAVRGE